MVTFLAWQVLVHVDEFELRWLDDVDSAFSVASAL